MGLLHDIVKDLGEKKNIDPEDVDFSSCWEDADRLDSSFKGTQYALLIIVRTAFALTHFSLAEIKETNADAYTSQEYLTWLRSDIRNKKFDYGPSGIIEEVESKWRNFHVLLKMFLQQNDHNQVVTGNVFCFTCAGPVLTRLLYRNR